MLIYFIVPFFPLIFINQDPESPGGKHGFLLTAQGEETIWHSSLCPRFLKEETLLHRRLFFFLVGLSCFAKEIITLTLGE